MLRPEVEPFSVQVVELVSGRVSTYLIGLPTFDIRSFISPWSWPSKKVKKGKYVTRSPNDHHDTDRTVRNRANEKPEILARAVVKKHCYHNIITIHMKVI